MFKAKYVFFGTPEFAAIILTKLIEASMPPVALVCNPDRPAGRKRIITPPETKVIAEKNNIPIFQPESLKDVKNQLEKLQADFFLVAAYAKIIHKDILSIPKSGTIGIHPSLLPRHRGATPIQNTILSGDEIGGVTLYLIDEKVDHGPILNGEAVKIRENENYESLEKKLAELGADLFIKIIPDYLLGKIKPQIQNEEYATYTKKLKTEDAFVDLEKDDPISIERKVRALNPEPGAWMMQNNKRVKILKAEIVEGKLKLTKIQAEGGKPKDL